MLTNIKIRIENAEQFYKVLQRLEMMGYRWESGDLPLARYEDYKDQYINPYGLFIANGRFSMTSLSDDAHTDIYSVESFMQMSLKESLQDGMLVQTKEEDSNLYLVLHDKIVQSQCYISLSRYNGDLTLKNGRIDNDFDIVRVYSGKDIFSLSKLENGVKEENLLWEREIPTEMTIAEIEEKLGVKNLKIVKEK